MGKRMCLPTFKKHFMNKSVSACLMFLSLSALFSFSVAAEEIGCDQLIVKRCEQCHYKTRICQKIGMKSKGQWKRSIKNMVKYGAVLNKDEQKRLWRCLSAPTKEIQTLCK